MRFSKGASGRISALVVVVAVLMMIAVPFTTMQYNMENSDGAPLVEVSYDANGGTGSVPATKKFEKGLDASEVLFDPLPTWAGYVFIGWSSSPSGPVEYGFTTPYEDRFFYGDNDTTFYAQWQAIPIISKISLGSGTNDPNRDVNREITWDAGLGTYKWRLGTGAWQNLGAGNNIIQFSGDGLRRGTIIFSLTNNIPFPDDSRLYVVFDNISVATGSTDTGNAVDIRPGAKVILQLVGNNTILHDGGPYCGYATIRVADVGGMRSELVITGQGNGNLTIKKAGSAGYSTRNPSVGSVIGGDGDNVAVGNHGETAGHIQVESGKLDIAYLSDRLRGAVIGGGGAQDGSAHSGGDGGLFEMHGGSIKTYQEATLQSISAPAIGGGGIYGSASERAGHGGIITITGGSLDITQFCDDNTYGVRSSAIGGAASRSAQAGDSGTINISGGNIKITQTGGAISGAGIGAAAGQVASATPGHATGTNGSGGQNYIAISGGHIEIYQTNDGSPTFGTLTGAGIGGGAGSSPSVKGGGADVRISGGYVLVDRRSISNISNPQGAAIGGGAEESEASSVLITGGNVNVKVYVTSGTSANCAGAAIGSSLNPHAGSSVQIDGGVINISRMQGTTPLTVPVGPNGDFGKSPIINGGSIRASYNQDLTAGSPADSDGNSLMRYIVDLVPADNPQSLFVRKATVTYAEYDGTKRYVDFHVQGKHVDLETGIVDQWYNLYLPAGSATDLNEISLEYASNGLVKTFSGYGGGVVTQTDAGTTFYRVVYRIGEELRYEDDIVHIDNAALLKQSIRAKNAYLNDVVAPWSLTYVERHNINYNDGTAAKSVTSLASQYRYFASETPLVLAVGTSQVLTSYGNIEFNTPISGRLVITAEEAKRINVQYRDDYTYTLDPSIPAARHIERVFGERYEVAVGYAKDSSAATGPWAQDSAPIAVPLPEPSDVLWVSDYFMFEHWKLNDAVSGLQYSTDDSIRYYLPAGTGDMVFYSTWEWKGKVYRTENGPGHIEYSLDGGTTWDTSAFVDIGGTFFPAPLQTVLLKAMPDPASVFLQWGDAYGHVTGKISDASVTVTVPGDSKYATAEFRAGGYCITSAVYGNGKISPGGPIFLDLNGDQRFVITPETGSVIKDVIVDGISVGQVGSYAFLSVYSDHTIEARFSKMPVITGTGGEGVTVNPSGPVYIQPGNSHALSWTAEPGYAVNDVVIDGISHPELINERGYTFTNILSNHTIVVTAVKRDVFYLTVIVEGKGYAEYSLDGGETFIRYTGRSEIEPRKDLVLRAVSDDGYEFVRWEGSVNGTSETITIESIESDVAETLVFQKALDIILVLMAVGISSGSAFIAVVAWARVRVDVVMIDSEKALIFGKRNARTNKPYRFFVDFDGKEGFVTYRVGENQVWKELIQCGGRYEIPGEDVTGTLTIRAR